MGMSIDDHIEVLKSYHNGFTGYVGNLQDSIDVAIDTMQKYQKIEEIVNSAHTRLVYDRKFEDIKKVIENGNDK